MASTRLALQTLSKNHYNSRAWTRLLKPKPKFLIGPASYRLSLINNTTKVKLIRSNLELISHGDRHLLCNDTYVKRPLLVLFAWMSAKRKHYMKLVDFYMEQGFDCVVVTTNPSQLMWPLKGSKPLAASVLTFLENNPFYDQIIIHGFSVGGYIYGEVLDLINKNQTKYENVVKRISGQVWDSAVDVNELPIGTPKAVFPNNMLLQNMLRKYLEYHMKAFYTKSTQYYINASEQFHQNPIRAPALFFVSKIDPIATLEVNLKATDSWARLGIPTYVKIFEDTPHVGHFRKHPKKYINELYVFLKKLGLIHDEEKIKARL